jgi:hypothetical protein
MGKTHREYEQKNGKTKTTGLAYRRIVVKLGTRLLTGGGSHLDKKVMTDLARRSPACTSRARRSSSFPPGHRRRADKLGISGKSRASPTSRCWPRWGRSAR